LDEDEEIQAREHPLYHPTIMLNYEQKARATAPLVQRFLHAERDSDGGLEMENGLTIPVNLRHFVDKKEKEEFERFS
jgi:hypothetical protein